MDPQDIDPEEMVRKQFETDRIRIKSRATHYYGDTVRKLFLGAGIAILVFLPFNKDFLSSYFFLLVCCILVFALLAGLTSRKRRWSIIADLVIAAIALVGFEIAAIAQYSGNGKFFDPISLFWQGLALNFFFALYFSCKTLRAWWDNPHNTIRD
jgi:uncharacterized membrane protein